ncbi:glycosyltransferase family 4 protein [Sphingobacterium siyangense]|uniref:glycosyltransferase family 4 protein n=1 Tax=Sphingobacterium siyangense TaxID=459529 RepID=UPI003DA63C39
MRIAIDGRLINKSQNTGISRYTEYLINYYLERYHDSDLFLITNDHTISYKGVSSVYCEHKPFGLFGFLRFSKFVKNLSVDLLHSPFYSGLVTPIKGTKNIVTTHDLMYRLVPGFFGRNGFVSYLKIKYFNFIVQNSLKNSTQIISVSETTQKDVAKVYQLNSVHIPEESDVGTELDITILKRYNLETKSYFFYCGNNRPHKNIEFIAEIFSANANFPTLVLAGNGHHSRSNVVATGVVSEEELRALYTHAIAFVFPSKYEGFGLPVLESLRCKTIVVASDIPAFNEFRSNNILFFKEGDKQEFIRAIDTAQIKGYVDEPLFFNSYGKKKIYQLLDQLIQVVLNDRERK